MKLPSILARAVRPLPAAWPLQRGATRRLSLELLEPRIALTAAGLIPVGTQPDGGLSGKVTYIMGGHGYTTYFLDQAPPEDVVPDYWSFQRGAALGMVEDIGNQEQMTALADYLFRAGATVVPMRPIGYQPLEVVLDNDDPGVTFTTTGSGLWNNSTATQFYGSVGDIPYKYAAISATETAVAKYQPNIPQAGFYPVYSWTRAGTDRVSDQLYRINHSGGSTEVTVNHRRVGTGLVYLGTYYFEAGTSGSVEISNRSSESGPDKYVFADMIRFGNGMGATNHGLGVSGRTREDEPALYWIQWHAEHAQGVPESAYRTTYDDDSATVGASPRYSTFMNQAGDGSLSDRVLVSFHSNAAGDRGVVGLHNTSHGGDTPNQVLLAQTLAAEVNNDMVAQNGQYEFNWNNHSGPDLLFEHPDFNYGELNNNIINNEFDATIIEVAYHDDAMDAALMRDPKVRDAIGRATYQGLVKYFDALDAVTPLTMLPGKVPQVRAEVLDADSVKITWTAPAANAYNGDAAANFRIYGSTNGYGFDGGTFVAGGATTTYTFNGLNAAEGAYYFKVAAVNAGGEGAASEVVAAIPGDFSSKVLIVNGFDRLGRTQDPTQIVEGVEIDRVRPRFSNSYDYAVQFAAAIEANTTKVQVDTASNEMVISGAVNLANYDAVLWISGEESTADDTFNATEQTLVTNYLNGGGKLFVSGAEIGWDLDAQGGGGAFYNNALKADYAADAAGSFTTSGSAGSILQGIALTFDNGALIYEVDFPDRINAIGGSTVAMTYTAPGSGGAAIQYAHPSNGSKVVTFGFPFETITTAANRAAVMDRVLRFFIPNADFNTSSRIDGADFLAWQRGFGTPSNAAPTAGDADGDRNVDDADLAIWRTQFGDAAFLASAAQASTSALASSASTSASPSASEAASRSSIDQLSFTPSFLDAVAGGLMRPSNPSPRRDGTGKSEDGPSASPPSTPDAAGLSQSAPQARSSRSWKRFPPPENGTAEPGAAAAIDGALDAFAGSSWRLAAW